MIIWKPFGVQFGSKAVLGPNEVGVDVIDVLDESSPSEDDGDSNIVRAETGSEPVSEMGDLGTGLEPVPEVGEVGVEPPSIFEENVDMSFDKVADFERDEEVDPPVVIVQPKIISLPQPIEGPKKKRIKTLAGRTNLPLVRQFRAMQAKALQTQSTKSKPLVQPTRKSFRIGWIAIQSTQKPRKKSGSSKQSPPEIEKIVSCPEESSLRNPEITLEEQGLPETPVVSKSAAPTEPPSEPTLSALKKSIVKRKLSPKQPRTQGPTEKSPTEPSAKKAKKTAPSTPSHRLAQLLQIGVLRGKIVKV